MDPNVPSFFLIILSGFGIVWSFRHFAYRRYIKISDFEYLAFSTLWGSIICIPVFIGIEKDLNLFAGVLTYPFVATPFLFLIGFVVGSISGYIARLMGRVTFPRIIDSGAIDDDMYELAKEAVIKEGKASTSDIQRKLRVGYARAARLIDILEEKGVVGPAVGSEPRKVISPKDIS